MICMYIVKFIVPLIKAYTYIPQTTCVLTPRRAPWRHYRTVGNIADVTLTTAYIYIYISCKPRMNSISRCRLSSRGIAMLNIRRSHRNVLPSTWESPYLGKTVFILRQCPDGCMQQLNAIQLGVTYMLVLEPCVMICMYIVKFILPLIKFTRTFPRQFWCSHQGETLGVIIVPLRTLQVLH